MDRQEHTPRIDGKARNRLEWSMAKGDLCREVLSLGFPREFGDLLAKELGSPKAIGRMTSYLKCTKPHSVEMIVDDLLLSGHLENHLHAMDADATDMADRLTAQLSAAEGLTEALKAADPLAWVARMNTIRARVREMVNDELIHS